MMAGFCSVTRDWPSLVPHTLRFGLASKRTARRAETENTSFNFEPVLKAAHRVWGPMFEEHAKQKLDPMYEPVLGNKFDISNGKQWEVDFLGVGSGKEAWEEFAKDHKTYMNEETRGKLRKPHFIAEIGLTTQTLKKKFADKAKSLQVLHDFVSSVEASSFAAVKCLVYDGADAEDFTQSQEANTFLDTGGALVNVPYLSAETVLAKFDETAKLKEEIKNQTEKIEKLTEIIQGHAV